jgi:hypothetical protein
MGLAVAFLKDSKCKAAFILKYQRESRVNYFAAVDFGALPYGQCRQPLLQQ